MGVRIVCDRFEPTVVRKTYARSTFPERRQREQTYTV